MLLTIQLGPISECTAGSGIENLLRVQCWGQPWCRALFREAIAFCYPNELLQCRNRNATVLNVTLFDQPNPLFLACVWVLIKPGLLEMPERPALASALRLACKVMMQVVHKLKNINAFLTCTFKK